MAQDKEIPFDLSKSMWGDMVSQCGGDAEKAKQMWTGVAAEEDQSERDRKIRSLVRNFPTLAVEFIEQKLKEHNWDEDATILPLWRALEDTKEAERKKSREEEQRQREVERDKRRKEANTQARSFLQNLFAQIPGDQIQAMLDANEGDVDTTTEQLLKLSKEQENLRDAEVKKAQQEQELIRKQQELERQAKYDTVKKMFIEFVSEEEIIEALKSHEWNLKEVTRVLLELTERRKIEQLNRLFSALSLDRIQTALESVNWSMSQAMVQLQDQQSSLRRSDTVVDKSKGKEKEQQKEPLTTTTTTPLVEVKVIESPKPAETTPTAADGEAFMMRSAIIERELNELIEAQKAAEEEEQTPEALFKKMLCDKIRFGPDAVPGLPGMVPLTPKLIDQLHGRKPFESQVMDRPAASTPIDAPPSAGDGEVLIAGNETSTVTLKVSPTRVDVGQKITVEWESQNDTTTSDWIGMYRGDASSSQYTTWNWIGKALKTGSLTFTPSEFGQYNFRYFSKSRTNLLATSEVVNVGPSYTMTTSQVQGEAKKIAVKVTQQSGHVYPSAWVGMYLKSQQDNKQYMTYEWLSSAVDNTITFDVPKTGNYEFRLFPLKNYLDVARASLDLQGQDVLTMKLEAGVLKITCDIQTVDPSVESAWIGIYLAAENDHRQYKKYKYISVSKGEVTFVAPSITGVYEARLFANKSLDAPVVVSNAVNTAA